MSRISSIILLLSVFACSKDESNQNFNDCNAVLDENCVCITLYDPVCGCNGVTYGNNCEASCSGIAVSERGPCKYDISPLLGTWTFLGYTSEGAAANKIKTHIYEMSIDFKNTNVESRFEVEGKSSTNYFGGSYEIANLGRLNLNAELRTKIACLYESCAYEEKFIDNLNVASEYKIGGNYLSINTRFYGQGDNPKFQDDVMIFLRK